MLALQHDEIDDEEIADDHLAVAELEHDHTHVAANDPLYPHARTHAVAPPRAARVPAPILYEEYHPYGSSAYRAVSSTVEVSAKRYRYTGKERDEETGLDHMGARYYASWLGRWTAADPIGLGDGVNRYAYVRGNPVGMKDPSGTQGVHADRLQELGQQQAQLLEQHKSAKGSARNEIESALEQNAYEMASVHEQQVDDLARRAAADPVSRWERSVSRTTGGGLAVARWGRSLEGVTPEAVAEAGRVAAAPLGAAEPEPPSWSTVAVNALVTLPAEPFLSAYGALGPGEAAKAEEARQAIRPVPYSPSEQAIGGLLEGLLQAGMTAGVGGGKAPRVPAPSKVGPTAEKAARSFFTVQNAEDAARLKGGGTPWPTGPTRAHIGEGAYTFESRGAADAYREALRQHVPDGVELQVVELQIAEADLEGLARLDLRGSDAAAEAFVERHSSLYGAGEPHGFEHVVRPTAQAPEHFFAASVFHLFKVLF